MGVLNDKRCKNLMNDPSSDHNLSFLYIQTFILDKQKTNDTFFIGRLSGNEPNLCGKILSGQSITQHSYLLQNMLFGAGIQFKTKEDIKQYVKKYNQSVANCDLLGVWDGVMYTQAKEYYEFIEKTLQPGLEKKKICAHALEPYYFMDLPEYRFNEVFKNKRILIITSHEQTTNKQIDNIENIFISKSIFDKETTKFHVYKPPQQNGGNHDGQSWLVHFDIMKRELSELIREFDFDIALVSCGGFGMPVCDFIFSDLKKSVIYAGGSLQLWFGIMGSRWKNSPEISKHVNAYWRWPVEEDKPKRPELCEGNCYW